MLPHQVEKKLAVADWIGLLNIIRIKHGTHTYMLIYVICLVVLICFHNVLEPGLDWIILFIIVI